MLSSSKSVAIVGAGSSGISAYRGLLTEGFNNITVFERTGKIGGIWAQVKYPDLRIHSKSFNYRFIDEQAVSSDSERASGEEIHDYLNAYADKFGLIGNVRFNCDVQKIVYCKGTGPDYCELTYVDRISGEEKVQCFDYVVLALGFSISGSPNMPVLSQKDFHGKVIHSSEVNAEVLEKAVAGGEGICIYGAGKSAFDILLYLNKIRASKFHWVYRKSLWSISYDIFYSKAGVVYLLYFVILQKVARKFKGAGRLYKLMQYPVKKMGFFLNPIEQSSTVLNCRASIISNEQYETLRGIEKSHGEIYALESKHALLVDGTKVPAGLLICATGFDRAGNLPDLFIKDCDGAERPYDLSQTHSFFRHMIDKNIPNMAVFIANPIYLQQLFGFSLSSIWLARYFSGKLEERVSVEAINKALTKDLKRFKPWMNRDSYLSNGMPYLENYDIEDSIKGLLIDLGISRYFAKLVVASMNSPVLFNYVCDVLNRRLFSQP